MTARAPVNSKTTSCVAVLSRRQLPWWSYRKGTKHLKSDTHHLNSRHSQRSRSSHAGCTNHATKRHTLRFILTLITHDRRKYQAAKKGEIALGCNHYLDVGYTPLFDNRTPWILSGHSFRHFSTRTGIELNQEKLNKWETCSLRKHAALHWVKRRHFPYQHDRSEDIKRGLHACTSTLAFFTLQLV